MHIPVMLHETIDRLNVKSGGIYLDCTLGDGGHSGEILRRLGPDGRLLALDRDESAICRAKANLSKYLDKITIAHTNHSSVGEVCEELGFAAFDGALIDTGVSSEQLDEAQRGFSFRASGPLDMRMDTSKGITAKDLVMSLEERELADLFYTLGEERSSRIIAARIVREREKRVIETTGDLANIVEMALGRQAGVRKHHPATKVFQALRMRVHMELESLDSALEAILPRLKKGGRLAVITFESISDRLVKHAFGRHVGKIVSLEQGGARWEGTEPRVIKVDKHAVAPSDEECSQNPRSRSAKLRVVERI